MRYSFSTDYILAKNFQYTEILWIGRDLILAVMHYINSDQTCTNFCTFLTGSYLTGIYEVNTM